MAEPLQNERTTDNIMSKGAYPDSSAALVRQNRELPASAHSTSIKRPALWFLVLAGATANVATTAAGYNFLVSALIGVVTVYFIYLLIKDYFINGR